MNHLDRFTCTVPTRAETIEIHGWLNKLCQTAQWDLPDIAGELP